MLIYCRNWFLTASFKEMYAFRKWRAKMMECSKRKVQKTMNRYDSVKSICVKIFLDIDFALIQLYIQVFKLLPRLRIRTKGSQ